MNINNRISPEDLHGKVIDINELHKLNLHRNAFISEDHKHFSEILKQEKIEFMPSITHELNLQQYELSSNDRKRAGYGKSKYHLILMGVLRNGTKVNVIIDGILPYFLVKVPDDLWYGKTQEDGLRSIDDFEVELSFEICTALEDNDLAFDKKRQVKVNTDFFLERIYDKKPFKIWQPFSSMYIKVSLPKLAERIAVIKHVQSKRYNTGSDDLYNYCRVVSRDLDLPISTWLELTNYIVVNDNPFLFTNRKDIKGGGCGRYASDYNELFKGITISVHYTDIKKLDVDLKDMKNSPQDLVFDRTLGLAWDEETFSPNGGDHENIENIIFSLSMVFRWVHDKTSFLKICLCDLPANSKPGYLTIVCGNQPNIILTFAYLFGRMAPETIIGFNDSSYDWKWLITKAKQYQGLPTMLYSLMSINIPKSMVEICTELHTNFSTYIYQYYNEDLASRFLYFYNNHLQTTSGTNTSINAFNPINDETVCKKYYSKIRIKIDAEQNAEGEVFELIGYICIDVRTVFRKIFPKEEQSSLKFFLEKCRLQGKDDMPYEKLFKYYKEYIEFLPRSNNEEWNKHMENLADINKYCVVDSDRCFDLMNAKLVMLDKRKLSVMSYTSLRDSFYNADGMRVWNMTVALGQRPPFNLIFSTRIHVDDENDKYPGALVFPPKKKLYTSKLTIKERIIKANELQSFSNLDSKKVELWKNASLDDADVIETFKFVKKNGAILTPLELDKIFNQEKDEWVNLRNSKRCRDFLTEPTYRPITGLDFSSLYPSIMRDRNFSPEYYLPITDEQAQEYMNSEYFRENNIKLVRVSFVYLGEPKVAYFIWHNCKYDTNSPDFRFGIFPYILDKLFADRDGLKKILSPIKDRIEEMEELDTESNKEYLKDPKNKEEYDDHKFWYSYYNTNQGVVKIYMNTFYGVTGNISSPLYVLELAGGITTYGQSNLRRARQVVEALGCEVHYGDTDSLYISLKQSLFDEIDREYYGGGGGGVTLGGGGISKLDYWRKLVEITMKEIDVIKNSVNEMFKKENGTHFLKVAYEEVCWPMALEGKKKYFAIPHEKIINFSPKQLFIRGMDIKKRGVCDFLKKVIGDIMWQVMRVDNVYTPLELVERKIDEIYSKQWDLKDFVQTAVYRPPKEGKQGNTRINTFVKRMQEANITIQRFERFSYIMVEKYPFKYDLHGRKNKLSSGEQMELYDEAIKHGYNVNLDYYMQGSVIGQMGRLIVYHDLFDIPDDNLIKYITRKDEILSANKIPVYGGEMEKKLNEDSKKIETKIKSNADKYISNYCKKYYKRYLNLGKTLQAIYKSTNKVIQSAILSKKDRITCSLITCDIDLSKVKKSLMEISEKYAEKKVREEYNKEYDLITISNYILYKKNINNLIVESKILKPSNSINNTNGTNSTSSTNNNSQLSKFSNRIGNNRSNWNNTTAPILYVEKRIENRIPNNFRKNIFMGLSFHLNSEANVTMKYKNIQYITRMNTLIKSELERIEKEIDDNIELIHKFYTTIHNLNSNMVDNIKNNIDITDDVYKPISDTSLDVKEEEFETDKNENEIANIKEDAYGADPDEPELDDYTDTIKYLVSDYTPNNLDKILKSIDQNDPVVKKYLDLFQDESFNITLKLIRNIYIDLVGVYTLLYETNMLSEYVSSRIAKDDGITLIPDKKKHIRNIYNASTIIADKFTGKFPQ